MSEGGDFSSHWLEIKRGSSDSPFLQRALLEVLSDDLLLEEDGRRTLDYSYKRGERKKPKDINLKSDSRARYRQNKKEGKEGNKKNDRGES